MGAIEEITLSRRADLSRPPQGDDRYYSHRLNHPLLRSKVPVDFCMEAARLLLERPGRVLISTGFFQAQPFEQPVQGGTTEADGPAGAYALGMALEKLGSSATYVVDRYCMIPFIDLPGADDVVDYPIVGHEESRAFAQKLLAEKRPTVVVATERPGITVTGQYQNSRGWDLSNFIAKHDYLFEHPATIGIIDRGNEIGGGNIAAYQDMIDPPLGANACATRVSHLVYCGSCNGGAYAVVAALSVLTNRNLLITPEEEKKLIDGWTERGVTDGGGQPVPVYEPTLPTLHALLDQMGVPRG